MGSHNFLYTTVFLVMIYHTLPGFVTATLNYTPYRLISGGNSTQSEPWLSHTATKYLPTVTTKDLNSSLRVHSVLPSLPTLPSTISHCREMEDTLTGRTGTIAVTETLDCTEKRTWNVNLPSSKDGMVIQVNNMDMIPLCSLKIYRITARSKARFVWKPFNGVNRPLLLRASRAKVVLRKKRKYAGRVCVVFNLTYAAHAVRNMPQEIVEAGSLDFYNCSGDVLVPSALRCNMVRECAGNEDEDQCDYITPGCGDWVPLREHCLKLEFVVHTLRLTWRKNPTIPVEAENTCFTRYGARLAQLRDIDDVKYVGRIIRQAGFNDASIGAKRWMPASKRLSHLYRFLGQWGGRGSPIVFYGKAMMSENRCMKIQTTTTDSYPEPIPCTSKLVIPEGYVCMKPSSSHNKVQINKLLSIHLPKPSQEITQFPTRQCQDGSLVQIFHLCHHETRQETMALSSQSAALFACRYGPPVHYTLVCDGNVDCPDVSDETECGIVKFPLLLKSVFGCDQFQLVSKANRCDGKRDCFDDSDEHGCDPCASITHIFCRGKGCLPNDDFSCDLFRPPSFSGQECDNCSQVVSMNGYGAAFLQPTNDTNMAGTFPCRDRDYYIPSFLLNNGERDCKYGEDENIPLTNFTCPGFYRCRDSYSCVHPDHVCDGIHHCPYKDDERYCDLACPEGCLCEGHVFLCTGISNISVLMQARSLDLSGSRNPPLHELYLLELLQFLNLSHCGLTSVTLTNMPQLQRLDFSCNALNNISSVAVNGVPRLRYLDLSGNPFLQVLDSRFDSFMKHSGLKRLQHLVLSKTDIHYMTDRVFSQLPQLEILDLRNNLIDSYSRHVFWGLHSLQQLYTDDSMLCCPYFHSSDKINCVAPFDELSSCNDLLRMNIFRVSLWLMGPLAILGNVGFFVYINVYGKQRTTSNFRVLITNQCATDLIMGVYMIIIGIADAQFQEQYVSKEKVWKRSVVCKAAGFLSFVSSEASALTICLITLDLVLVLCFPLKAHLHIGVRSSLVACGVVWFVALTLAAVPLLAGLQFYGISSICLPLPITRPEFGGHFYAFGVFIVFNFVLFVITGLGQIFIYRAILRASKAVRSSRQSQEITIAHRLFPVIVSDFCYWFPIGLMGILMASGLPISDEINVWAAIFVLPLNSALNPGLFVINSFFIKWQKEKLKKETRKILASVQRQLPKVPHRAVEELIRVCVRYTVGSRERILHILHVQQGGPVDTLSPDDTSLTGTGSVTVKNDMFT